jgi:hypothetical protein
MKTVQCLICTLFAWNYDPIFVPVAYSMSSRNICHQSHPRVILVTISDSIQLFFLDKLWRVWNSRCWLLDTTHCRCRCSSCWWLEDVLVITRLLGVRNYPFVYFSRRLFSATVTACRSGTGTGGCTGTATAKDVVCSCLVNGSTLTPRLELLFQWKF